MRIKNYKKFIILVSTVLLVVPVIIWGQEGKIVCKRQSCHFNSGMYNGTDNIGEKTVSVFQKSVHAGNAGWLRLEFGECNLGENSYITITSMEDGGTQRLDAESMKQWNYSSAFFNGNAVLIDLYVAPQDKGVFLETKSIITEDEESLFTNLEKIAGDYCPFGGMCEGDDDRSPTTPTDDAIGRIFRIDTSGDTAYASTGFIVSNGFLLGAGHAISAEGTKIIEFSVPQSTSYGTPIHSDPDDQYTVNLDHKELEANGDGNDWAVFECNPNSNTGLSPVQAQGAFYRLTKVTTYYPTYRVTGYGYDHCPANTLEYSWTQQTSTGDSAGLRKTFYYEDLWLGHEVDVQTGNSGGPIIGTTNNLVAAIQTAGICNGTLPNKGTALANSDVATAIDTFPSPGTKYADCGHPASSEDGSVFDPYDTVAEAVTAVSSGGIVSIVTGSYDEHFTINKAVKLTAPVGSVTIGPSLAKYNNPGSHDIDPDIPVDEAIDEADKNVPKEFSLSKNYPNPFNSQTVLKYALPEACHVSLKIYNMLGEEVRVLANGPQGEGYKSVVWDGKDNSGELVSSGAYICKLVAGTFTQSSTMMFIK